jgi:glucose-fructose oxidoreductase
MKINESSLVKRKNSRRDFIKQISVGTVSLALSSPLIGSSLLNFETKSDRKMGIALVGLGGYSGGILAPALQETEECYLAGIVTGTPSKEKIWSEKYNIPKKNIYNYENFDEIASNDEIDIIYVVLPNNMHAEYTIRAARAGKHVICEKPMALNVRECEEMIKACEDNKVGLSIGYRMQFERTTQEIIRLGQDEVYGKVNLISAGAGFRMNRGGEWRTIKAMGGGPMEDVGIYALQAARYVTGEEPLSVTAQGYNSRPEIFKDVVETVSFQLEFPGGAIANLMGSFGFFIPDLFVTTEDGWFNLRPFWTYTGIKGETSDGRQLNFPQKTQQAVQMDEQAISFRDGKPLRVTGMEGLKDVKIINAVDESISKGGKKVQLI